jgi:hypothetical protein
LRTTDLLANEFQLFFRSSVIACAPEADLIKFDRQDGSYQLRKRAFQDAYVGRVATALTEKPEFSAAPTTLPMQGWPSN